MYESNLVSLFIEIDINFLGMKKLENAYKLNTHKLFMNFIKKYTKKPDNEGH